MAIFWEFLSVICLSGLVFVGILNFLGYFSCIVTDSAPRWLRRFSFPGSGWFRIASLEDPDLELSLQPVRSTLADNSTRVTRHDEEIASLRYDANELIRLQNVTNNTLSELFAIVDTQLNRSRAQSSRPSDNEQGNPMATAGSSSGDAPAS